MKQQLKGRFQQNGTSATMFQSVVFSNCLNASPVKMFLQMSWLYRLALCSIECHWALFCGTCKAKKRLVDFRNIDWWMGWTLGAERSERASVALARVVAAKDGSWLTYGVYECLLRSTDVSSNQKESGSFCKQAWYWMYFYVFLFV